MTCGEVLCCTKLMSVLLRVMNHTSRVYLICNPSFVFLVVLIVTRLFLNHNLRQYLMMNRLQIHHDLHLQFWSLDVLAVDRRLWLCSLVTSSISASRILSLPPVFAVVFAISPGVKDAFDTIIVFPTKLLPWWVNLLQLFAEGPVALFFPTITEGNCAVCLSRSQRPSAHLVRVIIRLITPSQSSGWARIFHA